MGNTIARVVNYWLKPQEKPSSSSQRSTPPLPDDVLALILTKLDVVSLCRCTAASKPEFADALPLVKSISTPLPPSFFLPERLTRWYGKLFLYSLHKTYDFINATHEYLAPLLSRLPWSNLCNLVFIPPMCFYIWLHTPRISPSGRRFVSKLKGLEFFEVELPAPPSADYLNNSTSWFRWDAKLTGDFGALFVMGDIQDDLTTKTSFLPMEELLRKVRTIIRHLMFHFFTVLHLSVSGVLEVASYLLFEDKMKWYWKNPWNHGNTHKMHFVSKDAGKYGRLSFLEDGSSEKNNINNNATVFRAMTCYVPTTLTVTNFDMNNGKDSQRIKNVWLFYVVIADLNRATEDLLKDLAGELERDVDDVARRELGDAVLKILADDNRRDWDDSKFWNPYHE